jgi:hypothetical protein
MPYTQLILDDVPQLSGDTALQLLDFLYALTGAIENQYFAQIHQATEQNPPHQDDLFKTDPDPVDFDDPLPDF